MRTTTTNNTIYLSDYLAMPMPKHARSRRALRRKIRTRQLLWQLLPYLVNAAGIAALLLLTIFGLTICAVALGG